MELMNLIMESCVEIIHHVAWPTVVLIIVLVFRKPLVRLLRRLKSARTGDVRLDFGPEDRNQLSKESVRLSEVTKDTLTWEHYTGILGLFAVTLGYSLLKYTPPDDRLMPTLMAVFKSIHSAIEKQAPTSPMLKEIRDIQRALSKRTAYL